MAHRYSKNERIEKFSSEPASVHYCSPRVADARMRQVLSRIGALEPGNYEDGKECADALSR
jgi:hypothetical protein